MFIPTDFRPLRPIDPISDHVECQQRKAYNEDNLLASLVLNTGFTAGKYITKFMKSEKIQTHASSKIKNGANSTETSFVGDVCHISFKDKIIPEFKLTELCKVYEFIKTFPYIRPHGHWF